MLMLAKAHQFPDSKLYEQSCPLLIHPEQHNEPSPKYFH